LLPLPCSSLHSPAHPQISPEETLSQLRHPQGPHLAANKTRLGTNLTNSINSSRARRRINRRSTPILHSYHLSFQLVHLHSCREAGAKTQQSQTWGLLEEMAAFLQTISVASGAQLVFLDFLLLCLSRVQTLSNSSLISLTRLTGPLTPSCLVDLEVLGCFLMP